MDAVSGHVCKPRKSHTTWLKSGGMAATNAALPSLPSVQATGTPKVKTAGLWPLRVSLEKATKMNDPSNLSSRITVTE